MNDQSVPSMEKRLRIVLAEDHEMVREGLKTLLNRQPDMQVIGEAADGAEAVERVKELLPDIVIMDISMPTINGLQATERLKQLCPDVKVVTLTRHTDAGSLQLLLCAGASGYVLKQSASAELVRAIRAVAAGGGYLDQAITGKVIDSYVTSQAKLTVAARGELTERESEILRLVAWGYSNKEIASHFRLSVKTVEAHKAHSMKKLGLKSRIEIVRYALLHEWLKEV
ncbi:MAG TPA: response regulator transcription factor [Blastocatellia bacterium]|nr:response regulator transcription factor [Blastocatellia bacterium]